MGSGEIEIGGPTIAFLHAEHRKTFEKKGRYEMASKRSGSKAKSGGAKTGKGKATMKSLKDLEAKDSQKVRAGSKAGRADFSNLSIMKVLDKTTPL